MSNVMKDDEKRTFPPMAEEEIRIIPGADGKPTRIEGLAVPYDQPSEDLGGFREIFARGSLTESIRSSDDKLADVEHNPSRLLGRTARGTLRFSETHRGVYASIDVPDTTVGRDAAEEVRSKLRDGMSVTFRGRTAKARFERRDGQLTRVIEQAELTGVGLTAGPAYPQTVGEITLRSLAAWREEQEGDERGDLEILGKRLDLEEVGD